jgi:D-3-phosphoglycerate dehydrogenase / 2-oxoglutarate reductase
MKVLVADSVSEKALDVLKSEASWEVVFLPKVPNGSVTEQIKDADALVVRSSTKADAALLDHAARLKVIGRAGIGVDNVDMDAATKKGIVVMNTPGGSSVSVAEHAMGLMLALSHRIPQADSTMKQGKWEKKKLMGSELRGKTLGVVGYGNIGREVARLAKTFGMTILAYDPYVSALHAGDHASKLVDLEELFRSSDYITLHCAATPETKHMLNAKTLASAQRGVRIVNCARGELVNEVDLLAALQSGHVAGAALDVFATEPPKESTQALVAHSNVIATPHIAGSTEEAQEIVGIKIAEQIRDYLLLGIPRNAVNLPAISPEEYQKLAPYVELGEKLGSFVAQIAPDRVSEIHLSYDGGLAELNTHLVKNAVLKGVLKKALADQVNIVNASSVAQARNIAVVELRSQRRVNFTNSLGIAVRSDGVSTTALGMVGTFGQLRILGVNDIDIEAPLRGDIIFIRNQDVPGVIGRVGTLLGSANVNIANFALGRDQDKKEAIGIVNVDSDVPESVIDQIKAIPAVRTARVVKL